VVVNRVATSRAAGRAGANPVVGATALVVVSLVVAKGIGPVVVSLVVAAKGIGPVVVSLAVAAKATEPAAEGRVVVAKATGRAAVARVAASRGVAATDRGAVSRVAVATGLVVVGLAAVVRVAAIPAAVRRLRVVATSRERAGRAVDTSPAKGPRRVPAEAITRAAARPPIRPAAARRQLRIHRSAPGDPGAL